jgi:DNA-binding XRE family transcriptional regulator
MNDSSNKEALLYQIVGQNVKNFRLKSKISQLELSKNVGVSRISIVNIESGKQRPSLYLISQIAECLARSLHEVIPAGIIEPNPENTSFIPPQKIEVTGLDSYKDYFGKFEKGNHEQKTKKRN